MRQSLRLDGLAQRLQPLLGLGLAEVVPQADKLFAAKTCQPVQRPPRIALQHLRHGTQRLISRRMPVMVVVALEIVDIQQGHCQCLAFALGESPDALCLLVEGSPIKQPGEEVALGHFAQQLLAQEVFPRGIFHEIATYRADQVGGSQEEQVVQQRLARQADVQSHPDITGKHQPATQHGGAKT